MSRKSAWLELSVRMTLTLRACSFFVYLSRKGNINFIKGTIEGEEGVGVCVCCDPKWK